MSAPLRLFPNRRAAVTSPIRQAAEPALLYIVLCIPYILFSGQVAARVAKTPEELRRIETIKGAVFIIVTGVFFFVYSFVQWRRIQRQQETIRTQEASLLQSERKLVAAMSAATVAHDVNNLIMSLYGLVEALKAREGEDPFLRSMSEQIGLFIDKLSHLAKRLTTAVGRATQERNEEVDLQKTIRELAEVIRKHPDVRTCAVNAELASARLILHRTLFEEAVVNLVINAAQATGPGGRIDINLSTEPGAVILAVHDNGPGVPEELAKDIFEPCFTTKPEGTGIGLLAVRAFAASCGAALSVGRSPLGGAVFQLRIPVPASQDADLASAAKPAGATG
jgi:two-component system sensor histidine kinase HydH